MYKQLSNKTTLFIITEKSLQNISKTICDSRGYLVDYILIERNIYNKVKEHKELWSIFQYSLRPEIGKIETF